MSLIVQKFGGSSLADCDKLLHISHIVKTAYEKGNDILSNLSLKVYKGKINAILGPNSSGKTTLLKNIAPNTDTVIICSLFFKINIIK